jgi:hypothetical protein
MAIVINGAAGVGPKARAFPSWILHVQFDGTRTTRVQHMRTHTGTWAVVCYRRGFVHAQARLGARGGLDRVASVTTSTLNPKPYSTVYISAPPVSSARSHVQYSPITWSPSIPDYSSSLELIERTVEGGERGAGAGGGGGGGVRERERVLMKNSKRSANSVHSNPSPPAPPALVCADVYLGNGHTGEDALVSEAGEGVIGRRDHACA